MDALVEIFQESIETGEVPMDFKCANVVPILYIKRGLIMTRGIISQSV